MTSTLEGCTGEEGSERTALADLELVFEAAAGTPLDDPSWRQLRVAARRSTTALVAAGLLPPHLQVSLNDPPVVTARVLALAWRRTRCAAGTERNVSCPAKGSLVERRAAR